ncbi:MAG: hypothetical protein ABSA96_07330 [Candidatus Acidiferrales bacterium]|jgi:hypothetical protein
MPNCFYIRMRLGTGGEDLAEELWEKNRIGIWFGGWTPIDYQRSLEVTPSERLQLFKEANTRTGVKWQWKRVGELGVIDRFYQIKPDDWVCTSFAGCLHIAHVNVPVELADAKYTRDCEPLKWREIIAKRKFRLSELPDSYRLITAAQGALYQIRSYDIAMRILAVSANEREAFQHVAQLSWNEWIDFLGPKGWESLCTGYLILQHDFLPTGLITGGTLKDFDMIGANFKTGERIFAQCKKDKNPLGKVPKEFLQAAEDLLGRDKVFLFAYGGCHNYPGVTVVTGEDIRKWFDQDSTGKRYWNIINGRGDDSS